MRNIHSKRLLAPAILVAIPALAGPAVSYGSDTYNVATKQLTEPELQYGNATFWNVVLTPGKVLGVADGAPTGYWDAYAYILPAGFELEVPSVTVGATTFTNVTATIGTMDSVGSVSGADSYDGHYLYIPAVTLPGKRFTNVVITVAHVDGVTNGFPAAAVDSFNTSTGQLSIPAVQVGEKAYTNVTVSVGSVISVNGSGSTPGGANSSTCYNPNNYATGTTTDLFYQGLTGPTSAYEVQSIVVAPSTFNGVANAVGIQNTTITSLGSSVATEYYDIASRFPILLELGLSAPSGDEVFTPGDQFFGALSYGQSLTTSGTLSSTGGSSSFTTTYVFEGLEDVTVPAGTFHAACKWSDTGNYGYGPSTILTWSSHQGVLLKVGTVELQSGTYNGAPLGP
jgi:hypothetical protein